MKKAPKRATKKTSEVKESEVARYALVDSNGLVTNIVLWDTKTQFPIPDNCKLIPAGLLSVGDRINSAGTIVPAPVDVPAPDQNTAVLANLAEAVASATDFQDLQTKVVAVLAASLNQSIT